VEGLGKWRGFGDGARRIAEGGSLAVDGSTMGMVVGSLSKGVEVRAGPGL